MARTKTKLKRTVIAEQISAALVELRGIPREVLQSIRDNANPKLFWVKIPKRGRSFPIYTERNPQFHDIQMYRIEYDRLVSAGLLFDYLYE